MIGVGIREIPHDLVERVESGSGRDLKLDKDIHEAIGHCVHRETRYYCIEDGNDYDSGFTCVACGQDTYGARVPIYTSSLDTVVSLIGTELPGWKWAAGEDAYVHTGGGLDICAGHNPSPARALLAACLRAIQAQAETLADAHSKNPPEA